MTTASPKPKPEILPENKLPIEHPEYRYPESMNPYYKKIRALERGAYSNHDAEDLKGQWASLFAPGTQALHLEIGCNGGHVTNALAERAPNIGHLGLDWKHKQVFLAAEKAAKKGIKNAIYLRAHALRLPYLFAPEELQRISIFFPDPWPTKSTWKNRYIRTEWLKGVAPLLAHGGEIHIKTDHRGYFDWICDAFKEVSDQYENTHLTFDKHAEHPNAQSLTIPDVTLFERLFIRDGLPIHEGVWRIR